MHWTRWMIATMALTAAGCGGPSTGCYDHAERWTTYPSGFAVATPAERPELALGGAAIDEGLASGERTRAEGAAAVGAALADAHVERWSVEQATRAVTSCYRLGAREEARAIVRAHPDLYAWDELGPGTSVTCAYVANASGGGELELTLTRADVERPAAVVFDPGTFGQAVSDLEVARDDDGWVSPDSERRFGEWPAPQDLAFLRAPVVAFAAGEHVAATRVPVACASFERPGPVPGQVYRLSRFDAGSPVDRLLVELCSGDELPTGEAEAQVAVWMAKDDLSWESFAAHEGRLGTFGSMESIRASHCNGAAAVLVRSGVDPRGRRFFGGEGGVPARAPVEPAPQAAPEPSPGPEAGKVS
jgi:hypothetical protein